MFEPQLGLGRHAASLIIAAMCAACSRQSPPPQTPPKASVTASRPTEGHRDHAAAAASNACELQAVYFDFDDDTLSQETRDVLTTAAQCYFRDRLPPHIVLTGAADPRGTEQYNLALGERRARAVQRFLVMLGVSDARISVHSMGEETAAGTDEASWRLDRRVVANSQ